MAKNTLAFDQIGGEDSPPVVLLHGLFGSRANLRSIARGLSNDYCVYSVDLPGHGDSPKPDDMSFMTMARMLKFFLEEHAIARCHLLGHSLGGKLAMQFASMWPESVSSLCLLDISPVAYTQRVHDPIFAAASSLPIHEITSRTQALTHFTDALGDKDTTQFILTNLQRGSDGGYAWRIEFEFLHEHYDQMMAAPQMQERYSGPALLLRGIRSHYAAEEHSAELQRWYPQIKVVDIDAGHWLHAEKPTDVINAVHSFMDDAHWA